MYFRINKSSKKEKRRSIINHSNQYNFVLNKRHEKSGIQDMKIYKTLKRRKKKKEIQDGG